MIRKNKYPIPAFTVPWHILVSTFDKQGLEVLVPGILAFNPSAIFYSTGGTGAKLREILGEKAASNFVAIEDYTGCPEMEGGLVKTLHPKIHAGLLAERGNPAHKNYLEVEMAKFGRGLGVYFDVFVGNLYPFGEVVVKDGNSPEAARCNIDIGGPTMMMAAAKNWHSVTVLSNPDQYEEFLRVLNENEGKIHAKERFEFAIDAIDVVSDFRFENWDFFIGRDFDRDVAPELEFTS